MYSTLSQIAGPAREPVDVELARQHCRIDHLEDDTLLGVYISAATSLAENYLGRVCITQTLRWSMTHSLPFGSGLPLIQPLWLPYGLIDRRPLDLPRAPIQSIARVALTRRNDADLVLTTNDYSSDLTATPGRFLLDGAVKPNPNQGLLVDFVAGYGNNPEDVPQIIRTGILLMTAFLYEHRGDEGEMPNLPFMLMSPLRLTTFG